jgi:uncharacterized protein (TIGR03435 family)
MITGSAISLSVLARVLAPEMARAVIDNSGLKGRFDISLEWAPDTHLDADSIGPAIAANGPDLPDIFTAIRDQLGLELKPARGKVEILVIDSAQKPSRN